jgi:diguanylate cyclase (GGDEF)-like protein
MQLHLPTLLLFSQLVTCTCGLMFLLGPRTSKQPFYAWFGGAFLSAPCASIFYLLAQYDDRWGWAWPAGNAMATVTVALTWIGARRINGRSLPWRMALLVPALVLAGVLLAAPRGGAWAGALPFYLSFSAFSGLAALEFWRSDLDAPPLVHARVLTIVCAVHSGWYLARAMALPALGQDHPVNAVVLGPANAAILMTLMIVVASLSLTAIAKERALRVADRLATEDALTGLLNRREFARRAADVQAPGVSPADCSLLLFDLDHFKSINDRHGHLIGDEVLKAFANVARRALREQDLLCRYGGEEFAALLPGMSAGEACEMAQRIHHGLASSDEPVFARVRPTTSVGVAFARSGTVPLAEMLRQADVALYRAKEAGRNRTVVYSEEGSRPESTSVRLRRLRLFG